MGDETNTDTTADTTTVLTAVDDTGVTDDNQNTDTNSDADSSAATSLSEAACISSSLFALPASTASAIREEINFMARIASSFPGTI